MPHPPQCSDAETLARFLLGRCRPEEVDKLAPHVESCARCTALLQTLEESDALLEAVQAGPAVLQEPPPLLVDQLCALRPMMHQTLPEGGSGLLGHLGQAAHDTAQELYAFLAPPRQPGEIGWLGPYRVLKVLGIGGMGVVFLAEDPQLQRQVALKTVRSLRTAKAEVRQRFLREARAAAAIEHEHVVPIYQVGEDGDVPYLAMQLLQGETLEDRLTREGRLPETDVVRIGREVAEGLAAAHARGLIHRDVKPGNIFLVSGRGVSGEWSQDDPVHHSPLTTHHSPPCVKLLDFGLARAPHDASPDGAVAAAGSQAAWTQVGTVAGTPGYISPEQARGESLDPRCDLFSLGCVLYRMCTGAAPFGGVTILDTLRAVQQEQPPPVRVINPAVSRALEAVIGNLLAKRREERYPSAQAVVTALAGLAGHAPRHKHWRWIGIAAAFLLALALTTYWLGRSVPSGTDDTTRSEGPGTTSLALELPCHFALAVDYPVGRQPFAVSVGDFNGDGKCDMVVSNINSNSLSVLLGKGDGTFGPASKVVTGKAPHRVVAADFDGDGRLDIAVCNKEDHAVQILLGNGDGSFRNAGSHDTALENTNLAVGDLDGDGKADLAVTDGDTMLVLLGNGNGTFRSARRYTLGGVPGPLAVADVNGDGKSDLVVSCVVGNYVTILLGNGDGSFGPPRSFGVGSGPGVAVVADFNGDGKPDIAIENVGTHDVTVLLGNGDGTFRTAVSYGAGMGPGGLAAGDFNGDGFLDLAVANHFSHNVSVLLGRGDGTFRPAEHYAVGQMPAGVAVGDFNGDGRVDLSVVNHLSHSVSVLLNQPPSPHFRIIANREIGAGIEYRTTVTALDAGNNPDPACTSTVVITCSDPQAIIPPPWKFKADDQGIRQLRVVLRTAGYQSLTVVDAANPLCHGRITVIVAPRSASHFRVSAATVVEAGKPCAIIVAALDEFDNPDSVYDGTVHLSSTAPGATLPADYTFAAGDGGTHVFRVVFPKEGEWTVRVSDTLRRALVGSSKVKVGPVR